MKFCQPHWNRLRAAIDSRGMGHLGAKSGEEAAAQAVKEIQGEAELKDFDPLMAAHWKIVEEFMKPLGPNGLYIMTGAYCPLCELVRLNPRPPGQEIDENWIVGVSGSLQQFCLEKGLITAN